MKNMIMVKRINFVKIFVLLLLVTPIVNAKNFQFMAIGDTSYVSASQLDQLVDRINHEPTRFTIHVGDIKSGSTLCSDDMFARVYSQFMSFDKPLIYTPGDNEWTDCHRKNNGPYDPIERLQKIRGMFFSSDQSLGRQPLTLELQSAHAAFRNFPENRRWAVENISFATIHMVGSNNNDQPELPSSSEFKLRNEANIAWMKEVFATARKQSHKAIVFAMQADTFYDPSKSPESGFIDWLTAFQQEMSSWKKPVLLIQGDSHVFKVDRPLASKGPGLDLVQRLVVPGALLTDAVVIEVDPDSATQIFTVRRLLN
ncbi:hypothetical protein MCEMSE6_02199 [Oxalobacteraceae bacterium]